MELFADTCDLVQIKRMVDLGIIDGVTTNPSILSKVNLDIKSAIAQICEIMSGSVSVEVLSDSYDDMLHEAREWLALGYSQLTIKLPITEDGIKACHTLSQQGVKVNMTLCFSVQQFLLAAKAGATYVSPFVGRLDDIGQSGMELVQDIVHILTNYPAIAAQVIVASVRSTEHVIKSAIIGADIVTAKPELILSMLENDMTKKGLELFKRDWHNRDG